MADFFDDFNRADDATTLGPNWAALSGIWGTQGSRAYCPSTGDFRVAVHDCGAADATASVKIAVVEDYIGIAFRATDANNYLIAYYNAGSVYLQKRVAGTFTLLDTLIAAVVAGDVLTITGAGNVLTVSLNGTVLFSSTDAFNNTVSKHGLFNLPAGAGRFDDFSIDDPAAGGGRSFATALAEWESRFSEATENLQGGPAYALANYGPPAPLAGTEDFNHYDPINTYQQIYGYTGDSAYLPVIDVAKYQYRDMFVLPSGGKIQTYHVNTQGLLHDYLRTGDVPSRDAVVLLNFNGSSDPAFSFTDNPTARRWNNAREASYALLACLAGEHAGQAHKARTDEFVPILKGMFDQWIAKTDHTGSPSVCTALQPMMSGIVMFALIAYYDRFGDSTIPPKIKEMIDYLWPLVDPTAQALPYWEEDVAPISADPACAEFGGSNTYDGGPQPTAAPTVQPMTSHAWAWYSWWTTDATEKTTYRSRYETLFVGSKSSGGVDGTLELWSPKEYNQAHLFDHSGLRWRARSLAAPAAATSFTLTAPASTTGQANRPSGLFKVSLPANTSVAAPVVVTPADGGAGGAFIPPTVRLTNDEPLAAFRYAPPASAAGTTVTITCTDSGGLTDPSGIGYTVSGVAAFATGYTITATGSPNPADQYSPPFDVALVPAGATLPRSCDARGGLLIIQIFGSAGGTSLPQYRTWVSSEDPAATFQFHPQGVATTQNIMPFNDAGLPDPADIPYTPAAAGGGPGPRHHYLSRRRCAG